MSVCVYADGFWYLSSSTFILMHATILTVVSFNEVFEIILNNISFNAINFDSLTGFCGDGTFLCPSFFM